MTEYQLVILRFRNLVIFCRLNYSPSLGPWINIITCMVPTKPFSWINKDSVGLFGITDDVWRVRFSPVVRYKQNGQHVCTSTRKQFCDFDLEPVCLRNAWIFLMTNTLWMSIQVFVGKPRNGNVFENIFRAKSRRPFRQMGMVLRHRGSHFVISARRIDVKIVWLVLLAHFTHRGSYCW